MKARAGGGSPAWAVTGALPGSGVVSEELTYLGPRHHVWAGDTDCQDGATASSTSGCHSGSSRTIIFWAAASKSAEPYRGSSAGKGRFPRGTALPGRPRAPERHRKVTQLILQIPLYHFTKSSGEKPKSRLFCPDCCSFPGQGYLWQNKFRKTWGRTQSLLLPT